MKHKYTLCLVACFFLVCCKKEIILQTNKKRQNVLLNGTQYKLWRDLHQTPTPLLEKYFYFDDQGRMCKLLYDCLSKDFKVQPNGRGSWEVLDDSTVLVDGKEYTGRRHIWEHIAFLIPKTGKDTLKLLDLYLPEVTMTPLFPGSREEHRAADARKKNYKTHKKLIMSSDLLKGCEYKIWKTRQDYLFSNYYLYFDNRGMYASLKYGIFFFLNHYDYSACECTWYQFGTTVFLEGNPTFTVYPQREDTLPVIYVGEKDTTYFFDQLGFYDPPKKSWLQKLGLKE